MTSGAVAVRLGSWAELQALAVPVRSAVFVDEQRVPAHLELDPWDALSLHAVALIDGAADAMALGTGRLLPDGHIGRLAVVRSARGCGIGAALLRALMEAARRCGHPEAVLNAQVHAVPFYRRFGFREEGNVFDEAGIAHLTMRAAL